MKKILLIQLSDAHIEVASNFWSEDRAKLIARSAVNSSVYERVFVVFSGDVAYRGSVDEYALAEKFISSIVDEIKKITQLSAQVIVAPGNHDCDFSNKSKLRDYAISCKEDETFSNGELLDKLIEPLKNYNNFESRVETFNFSSKSAKYKSGSICIDKYKIQFRVFNSPVFSQIKEKKGDLYLPVDIFDQHWEDASLRIAVMHHPTPWFDQNISREIRTALRTNATITLYGHEHYPEVTSVDAYNKTLRMGSIEIDGPVLHGHEASEESAFLCLEIDLDENQLQVYLNTFSSLNNLYEKKIINGIDSELRPIQLPCKKQFVVRSEFESKINDAGIPALKANGQPLDLLDIYIPPDLLSATSKSGVDDVTLASELLEISNYESGAVIQGDEKFGKTTLLYILFDGLYNTGYFPLYISLRDQQIKKPEDIDRAFKNSVCHIYANESHDSYSATDFDKRVFLIDDVDSLKNSTLRKYLVEYVKAHAKYFFITTTMKIKMTEILTNDNDGILGSLPQLSIDRFGAAKRSALIKRWILATNDDLEEEEFLKKVDTLEKAATGILGYNMVPRVPHMLLIFLQSNSAAGKASLESGALAHYYSFLVTENLLRVGVKKEELEEYFSFSRLISFNMHKSGKMYISQDDLEECNKVFSDDYYPGSSSARRNVLLNAKLLQEHGSDAYEWRHGYFHYLFLGEYLGKNIDDSNVRVIVEEMCGHLYVRSNANALLFLVHFSKDPFIFDCIQKITENLFAEEKQLSLGEDTKLFASIIKDAQLIYIADTKPVETRQKRYEASDINERKNGDGLSDVKKTDKLSVLEELIVLFKTAEIVGQVLKEQYASIKRSVREPVMVALLNSYLRSCGGLINKLAKNKDIIKNWVENEGNKDNKDMTVQESALRAEEVTANVVQMFMFGFFQKLGDSIASEKTLDLIKGIKWKNSTEAEAFMLACELNLQRPIPFAKIDKLLECANDDPAFVALIRNLVQMRLSMFHTKTADLQALGSRFKIPVNKLKKLTYVDSVKR